MGYTVNVYQYRSFTDDEWNELVDYLSQIKSMDIKFHEDRIEHIPYEGWVILKTIDGSEYKQWLKPGSGENEVAEIQTIANLIAPGTFSESECMLDDISQLLLSSGIQSIYLKDKIVYTLDNENLLEYHDKDDYHKIINLYIQKDNSYI